MNQSNMFGLSVARIALDWLGRADVSAFDAPDNLRAYVEWKLSSPDLFFALQKNKEFPT